MGCTQSCSLVLCLLFPFLLNKFIVDFYVWWMRECGVVFVCELCAILRKSTIHNSNGKIIVETSLIPFHFNINVTADFSYEYFLWIGILTSLSSTFRWENKATDWFKTLSRSIQHFSRLLSVNVPYPATPWAPFPAAAGTPARLLVAYPPILQLLLSIIDLLRWSAISVTLPRTDTAIARHPIWEVDISPCNFL